MKKVIKVSVKKVLGKKEQKAIVGGTCYDPDTHQTEGYPIWCYVDGVWQHVCPHVCD